MEPALFKNEFNKMFKWFTNDTTPGMLEFELDVYKKLFNFFVMGNTYHFILNHNSLTFEYVSREVEEVLGYTPNQYNFEFVNELLHPDDHSWFLTFGFKMIDFFSKLPIEKLTKYKLRYDMRYRKKNGDYARILYQGVMIEYDENGRLLRSLGMHTDITYLKQEGKPVLSFIGLDGEPSYVDVGTENIFIESKEALSRREKEVLKLLIEGKLSKEIGSILNISKQTVDTHRKNMLHKTNLNNTGELIGKAIRHGWI